MGTAAINAQDFVNTVANEMAAGIDRAVGHWMTQVEDALADSSLTTLGRMAAVKEIVERYKRSNGKDGLACRQA